MTCARSEIFISEESHFYHCISRCVRRAFLCGEDPYCGKNYEHRRAWIKARLTLLVKVFAFELGAYAIMSNHLHTVLRNRPDLAAGWSDEEVARRWLTLFPRRRKSKEAYRPNSTEINSVTVQPKLVAKYRKRLGNLSWFHRCLNEYIARQANEEDNCKGHFWEGRFKSIRLEDEAAVIACSVYVDLNPIRAGKSKTPESSDYTSIQDRLRQFRAGSHAQQTALGSAPKLLSVGELTGGVMSTREYLEVVDRTGRVIVDGKSSMPEDLVPILKRIRIGPQQWHRMTAKRQDMFRRIIGSVESLRRAAEAAGKRWFQGLRAAAEVFSAA